MTELIHQSAAALAAQIAQKTLTAEALMDATLTQIAAVNPTANALVSLRSRDDVMAAARAADQTEPVGPLHGVPMAIKDLAHVGGLATSMGSSVFAGQIARQSDPHVARLQVAGGIVIGKTNTPEFGLGSHTYNPVFGATENALVPGASAGGSSGGAAVALAQGMVPVADGSDMMGSLRNPAGWNGVYGLRPTIGMVPSGPDGDVFLHPLSTNGPMGRSPDDIALLLDIMAGPHHVQPLSNEVPRDQPTSDLEGVKIGWLGDWGGAWPMEDGILSYCAGQVQRFKDAGCTVTALDAPFSASELWEAWVTLRGWAVAAKLGPVLDAHPDQLKPEAAWEVAQGRALSAAQITRASAIRSDWYRAAARMFLNVDVVVVPTAQCWPFPKGWQWPQEIAGTAMDTYHRWMECVIPASLIGLPAMAVPTPRPIGLQLIGPVRSDAVLIQLGRAWERLNA